MSSMPTEEVSRRKRLIYRAHYRGFKEADIIIGGFVRAHAMKLAIADVADLEALLAQKDHDIYDWITGAAQVPPEFDTPVFARLKQYSPPAP